MTHTGILTSTDHLDLPSIRADIDATLDDFLTAKEDTAPGPELGALSGVLRRSLVGGKRIRPLLCVVGWHAGAGPAAGAASPSASASVSASVSVAGRPVRETPDAVLRLAAALELFQSFALVHDDIIDAADLRRGRPTAHRELAAAHASARVPAGRPDDPRSEAHGLSAGLLLGDLALVWSDELLHTAGLTPGQLSRVLPVLDLMRTEIVYGQYLDLVHTGRPAARPSVEDALRVLHYKTATYTVLRPLLTGAAAAGATDRVRRACEAYALPLGEAYQLRDDLLGLFGDPERTGKAGLGDLREGKATVPIALALHRATGPDLRLLRDRLGADDLTEAEAGRIRRIVDATGARSTAEDMITDRYKAALDALDSGALPPAVSAALREIALASTRRQS
ncbi:polyprenyl synthetase family protein [Phaeacidiphilus oryzae]|uniref:polyprenyl synthetase family protein n=1 Tax=Phaeacidiphilus oryzae TaxID=348818 RepID=UPI000689C2C6|nr:polyprenyl synthetase family protein [Phaeacidiphilus oryzae]